MVTLHIAPHTATGACRWLHKVKDMPDDDIMAARQLFQSLLDGSDNEQATALVSYMDFIR